MPQDPDPTELRALQAKAYGRDGGLSGAEAARLRELEAPIAAPAAGRADSHPARSAEPEHADDSPGADTSAPVSQATASDRPAADDRGAQDDSADAHDEGAESARSLLGLLRRSWKAVTVAAVLLVAVGIGAGWALFAPRAHDIVLSDDEVQRRVELAQSGLYDDGSLRPIARKDGALAWYATQEQGSTLCVILDAGGASQAGCAELSDGTLSGWGVSATVADTSGADEEQASTTQINAVLMLSTAGEPMVAIEKWNMQFSAADQYEGEERIRADELVDEGFDANLTLVGYFRDVPVWVADRYDDDGQYVSCLIVDAAESQTCVPPDVDGSFDSIAVSGDGGDGAWTATLTYTTWGNPYLTITENPGSATTVVIDTETGDPIEVKAPLTDPDG